MDTIPLKRFFVSLLCPLLFSLSPQAAAEPVIAFPFGNYPYTLSIDAMGGMLWGQAEELVYIQGPEDTNYYTLSQLLWDIKPLFYAGFSLRYGLDNPLEKIGLFGELSINFGFSGTKTGRMEDRDWMAPNHQLSHFSQHFNITQGAMFLDAGLGLSFPLVQFMALSAGLQFSYMYFDWDAVDGYLQHATSSTSYAVWDESIPKKYHFGPSISYSQTWFILAPKVSIYIPLAQTLFSFRLDFSIGPVLYMTARDIHHAHFRGGLPADSEYIDMIYSGLFLEPRGAFNFSPADKIGLSLFIAWRYIQGSMGTTSSRSSAQSSNPNDGAFVETKTPPGAGFQALNVGISLQLQF
ncbi:MAG: omptin family outer membrane protease [Treponema sp.]|jgi:outer membrane protease|nr:omptin family outer membrane protease [Treponema sp.]